MTLNILPPAKLWILRLTIIVVLFFSISNTYAQCDPVNKSIVVCEVADISSRTVDLFCGLVSYIPGGIWKDDSFTGGLNPVTGVLNIQAIGMSGVFNYTYNVLGSAPATVSVTVGGYAGVSNLGVPACSDNQSFNLFLGFKGDFLSPQSNGVWHDDDATGALNGSYLNASVAGIGPHYFTYTIPAIGSCSSKSSTILVTVKRAPESGIPTDLRLCSDNLAAYTNLDLFDLLTGEDSNGLWKEFSTSELSDGSDSTIDIQHIYNTLGAGVFSFAYTVKPLGADNTICSEKTSTVSITIEKQVDFSGAKLVVSSDICELEISTATYKAVLSQGSQSIPDGNYVVSYNVVGTSSTMSDSVTAKFASGVLNFNINRLMFPQVGDYTVTITDIIKEGGLGICNSTVNLASNVLHINLTPRINSGDLTIDPVCMGDSATVTISGNTSLTNGDYRIVYSLAGSNIAVAQQAVFSVSNSNGIFTIPSALIPHSGGNTILITNITNQTTGCTNTSNSSIAFEVKPRPDVSKLVVDIKDVCDNQPVSVLLSGLGTLTNINLSYNLTGKNSVLNQTVMVAVNSGTASFSIPSALIANTGITTLVLTDVIDNTNRCGTQISNGSKSFMINTIPSLPTVGDGRFCKNDKATIANLLPTGMQYQWFDSPTSTTVLSNNTPLETKIYYVKEVNLVTKCESGRVALNVTIDEVNAPVLDRDPLSFCGLDKPTINSLTAITSVNGTIEWYDAAVNGNLLVATELLKDEFTYYGFYYSSSTTCYSDALEVTVSLTNCDVTPEFFIPDGFSPNGDGVNDSFRIPDIEYIYPNFTLDIYSRYGNLLFSGNKNKLEWDGKNSDFKIGIDGVATSGVYFYIISYNKGNKAPKQGQLYLNR